MPSLEQISFVLTLAGALAGWYLFSWQVRAAPDDRQQWAALVFVASVSFTLTLLCWRYVGGPMVGGSLQGVAAFFGVMLSLIWLALETRAVNLDIQRDKRRERR